VTAPCDVERIAVLRANRLGDLVLALPALDALRAARPHAEIVLLGAGWHPELLDGRPGPWDRVVVVPGSPGVRDADTTEHDPAAVEAFLAGQRRERYDLAVQLHGGGRSSNPFVRALGARTSVGAHDRDAVPLDRSVPYSRHQHEVLRLLEVVGLAGAPAVGLEPRLAITDEDVRAADAALAAAGLADAGPGAAAPLVALHLGATDPRRRWPAARRARSGGGGGRRPPRRACWYAGCWTDEPCATGCRAWPAWTSTRSPRCRASRSTEPTRCWPGRWWQTPCSTCSSCPRCRCAPGRCARA